MKLASGNFDMSSSFVTGECRASTAKTEALPVLGLQIKWLSLYWIMPKAKYDLMPRIRCRSALSTKRQSRRNDLSFLQTRMLTQPLTLTFNPHRWQAMSWCELPFQVFHLWMLCYKYVVASHYTELLYLAEGEQNYQTLISLWSVVSHQVSRLLRLFGTFHWPTWLLSQMLWLPSTCMLLWSGFSFHTSGIPYPVRDRIPNFPYVYIRNCHTLSNCICADLAVAFSVYSWVRVSGFLALKEHSWSTLPVNVE